MNDNALDLKRTLVNNLQFERKLSPLSKAVILSATSILIWYIYTPSGINWIKFRQIIKTNIERSRASQ